MWTTSAEMTAVAKLWVLTLILKAVSVLAALPSDTFCTQYMCIRAVIDSPSRSVIYSLGPPADGPIPQSSFGWMAIGFGSQMANTPMIIVWPNSDQTFTISQRRSPSHAMPTPDSSAGFTATLMPALSYTNTSNTVISFSVPLSAVTMDSGRQSLIWAYGSTNPNSFDAGTSIMQHRASGDAVVNLLGINGTSSSGAAPTSTGPISIPTFGGADGSSTISNAPQAAVGRTRYQSALIVHAILGSLFAMLFLPLGVLIARFTRSTHADKPNKWWFPLHAAWQGIISLAIGAAAVALGYQLESKRGGGEVKSTHRTMGLVVLILLLAQCVLGVVTHWRRQILRMRSCKRSPLNYLHILLGVALLAVSWAQVWTGLDYEWPIWSGYGRAGTGWRAGWAVGVALPIVLYIAGCIFLLPKQLRAERAHGSAESVDQVNLHEPGGRQLADSEK